MGVFGQSGFREGSAAQYLRLVPQNVRGLLDRARGSAPADQPPSFPAGPAAFPPGVTPVELTTNPARTTAKVGASTTNTWTIPWSLRHDADQGSAYHQAPP